MSAGFIIDSLYRELLLAALFLLLILWYNNIMLYKQKLTDSLSLMLFAGVVMCVFELLTDCLDGHPSLSAFTYIAACGYSLAFIAFAVFFNYCFMKQFGLVSRNKRLAFVFYTAPFIIFLIFCISTPPGSGFLTQTPW